jgi:hypothetical protein
VGATHQAAEEDEEDGCGKDLALKIVRARVPDQDEQNDGADAQHPDCDPR